MSTATAIQNPFTFYYNNNETWSSNHSYQFWNKNFTSATTINNAATLKTIYDPSISGFTLPKTAAVTGFTKSGNNSNISSEFNVNGSFDKGWNFYTSGWKNGNTIFFSTCGYRNSYNNSGNVSEISSCGAYWTVGAYSMSKAYGFLIGKEYLNIQKTNMISYGFLCRSVLE